jgi:hypothetical protein
VLTFRRCVPPCQTAAVTLSFTGSLDHSAVVHAATLVRHLVARPEVADAWPEESSCTAMSVGALTRHLVEQSVYVVRLLGPDPVTRTDVERISLLEHYTGADWVGAPLDHDAHRFVREKSEGQATEGVEAAVGLQSDAVAAMPAILAAAADETFVPWANARLATDDFLVTRLMEMVVHSDDLAASVGVPAPAFGPAVLRPALGLLTELAVVRHGQDAVVRTLTRPQRAPASISAF